MEVLCLIILCQGLVSGVCKCVCVSSIICVFCFFVILICAFLRDTSFVYLPIMTICFRFILFAFVFIP